MSWLEADIYELEERISDLESELNGAERTIDFQDLVIDYLYDSLGSANDDIMRMAEEYAKKEMG